MRVEWAGSEMMGGRLSKREAGRTMPIDKNHNVKRIIVGASKVVFLRLPVRVRVMYRAARAVMSRGVWLQCEGPGAGLMNGFIGLTTGPGVRGGVMAGVPMSGGRFC